MRKINSKYIIVAYDIEDNGRRSKIAEMLQYYGLARIQYSVFAGEIPAKKLKEMNDRLLSMDLGDDDNITIVPVCGSCKDEVRSIKPLPEQIKHLSI